MAPTAAASADGQDAALRRSLEGDGGGDDGLMSFESPRASDQGKDEAGGGDETAELLAFYRRRCDEFQRERQRMLDRLAQIEVSKEETHRLKWELRSRTSELAELQESLARANAALLEAKRQRVDLEADNSALRLRERQDRDKIRQLLALTQPVAEQVAFARGRRPGARASFPVAPAAPRPFAYASTMHIASERMRSSFPSSSSAPPYSARPLGPRSGPSGVESDAGADAQPTKPLYRVVPASKVLRTVYLPSEQSGELAATVESLQKQLEAHRQLSEEKTRQLVEQFAEEKAALVRRRQELEEQAARLEAQAAKAQRVLAQTTKDYLVLRHRALEQERLAREELYSMSRRCDALQREREEAARQAAHEQELAQQAAREEGDQTALSLRAQALERERDLYMLKEQYAAVQQQCSARIQDLQARLAKLRERYRSLDRRRAMEMEGFSRDVAALKRHLQKLEVMHYGRRLTAQEREALRLDENYTLNSNELSAEIAALQHRIAELSADLADE